MRKHKWVRHLATPILPPLGDAVCSFTCPHSSAETISCSVGFIWKHSAVSSAQDGFYHLWYLLQLLILRMSASLTSLLGPWSRDLSPSSSLSDTAWRIPGDKKYLKDEILPDLPPGAPWKGYLLVAEVGCKEILNISSCLFPGFSWRCSYIKAVHQDLACLKLSCCISSRVQPPAPFTQCHWAHHYP